MKNLAATAITAGSICALAIAAPAMADAQNAMPQSTVSQPGQPGTLSQPGTMPNQNAVPDRDVMDDRNTIDDRDTLRDRDMMDDRTIQDRSMPDSTMDRNTMRTPGQTTGAMQSPNMAPGTSTMSNPNAMQNTSMMQPRPSAPPTTVTGDANWKAQSPEIVEQNSRGRVTKVRIEGRVYDVCMNKEQDSCINPRAAGLKFGNRPLMYWPGQPASSM